jgi:hypothetical protein
MLNLLTRLQAQFDHIEITNPKMAQLICLMVPDRCPFERRINAFGYVIQIPALCKLNPFYRQLIHLRLKSLNYLMRLEDLS